MPIHVDAYMAGGVASGMVDRAGQLRDLLETSTDLSIVQTSWQSLDGAPPQAGASLSLPVDEVLIVVSDDDPYHSMHASWHGINLVVGPYLVAGELPTLPGFDPGRALTRPSGEFVMLRDVRLGLVGDDDETVSVPHALVNRYGVDKVTADIMLGFFFPGAMMDESDLTPTTLSAGAPLLAASAGAGPEVPDDPAEPAEASDAAELELEPAYAPEPLI
jgi:hypothetical protein